MKRRWRVGHILLAILLLSLGCLVFYIWPTGPVWRVERQEPVGFDLSKGLLWTLVKKNSSSIELHGLNLQTGINEICHQLHSNSTGLWNPFMSRLTSQLSGNATTLICIIGKEGFLYDLHDQCQVLSSFRADGVESMALSPDGMLYVLLTYQHISVIECRSGKVKVHLPTPDGIISPSIDGYPPIVTIQISNDGRFLAIAGQDFSIAVIDLITGGIVGNCPKATIPVFLSDNTSLLALDNIDPMKWSHPFRRYSTLPETKSFIHPEWCHFHTESMKREMPSIAYGQQVLHANSDHLLLALTEASKRFPLLSWIPEVIRDKFAMLYGLQPVLMQNWNPNTFQLQNSFTIYIRELNRSVFSPDGEWLAIEDREKLVLWSGSPRRSIACWIVCCCIAFMALWLAWPRKKKLT